MQVRILIFSTSVALLSITPGLFGQAAPPSRESKFAELRSKFEAALARIRQTGQKEHEAVVSSYVDTLSKSQARLQTTGNLDRVLKIKEELETIKGGGGVTANQDPELDSPRKTYLNGKAAAHKKEHKQLEELNLAYVARLQVLESELTKGGAIDQALAARKEREHIQDEAANARPAPQVPAANNKADPPLAQTDPFRETTWTSQMTIPATRHRMLKNITIDLPKGSDESVDVVFPKGTTVTGSNTVELFIGRSNVTARDAEFINLRVRGDLSSKGVFQGCTLHNCTFGKGGGWFAGNNFSSKWQFDRCVIDRSFLDTLKIFDAGINISQCAIKNMTLPSVQFGAKDTSDVILSDWLQVRRTRFEKCKVPMSFLLITENCSFVECTFVQDDLTLPVTKPVIVSIYQDKCTSRMKPPPANVLINQRPLDELPKP